LEEIFAAHDFAHWRAKLATLDGVWAPLLSPDEVIDDPQAVENGFVARVATDDGRSYFGGASPAQFDEAPIGALRAAPRYGAHTEDVLREIGVSPKEIGKLRAVGVIA